MAPHNGAIVSLCGVLWWMLSKLIDCLLGQLGSVVLGSASFHI